MPELDPPLSLLRLLLAIALGVMATSSLSHVVFNFGVEKTLHIQLVWIMLILLLQRVMSAVMHRRDLSSASLPGELRSLGTGWSVSWDVPG